MKSSGGVVIAPSQKRPAPPCEALPSCSNRIALIFIPTAATAIVVPMFFLGNISGHDLLFHVASWIDVAGQWRHGVAFPRWAEWANWGFGEPRFIFYPPISWLFGAALGSILPWRAVPGAFIWLTLCLGGVAMWRLARKSLPDSQAIAAAVIFMLNPYQLVVVYYRSDFAELFAGVLFPLLVLGILKIVRRTEKQDWTTISLLAIVFAAIWLSNAPAAVMAIYSFALILVVGCIEQRNFKPLMNGAVVMVIGFGIAAFYILPAAYEQRWVQIAKVMHGSFNVEQNFLYSHALDPEFVLFNWKVSSIAVGTMLIAGIAAVFGARRRSECRTLWGMMLALALVSAFMTFPVSLVFWRNLPKLEFLQFPWRWLAVLAVPYAFFLATAIAQSRWRVICYTALLVIIAATAVAIGRDAWWDSEDIPHLETAIQTGHGYEGVDEYAPLGCNPSRLPGAIRAQDDPDSFEEQMPVSFVQQISPASSDDDAAPTAQISMEKQLPEKKEFQVETPEPSALALRLLSYPAWETQVNGTVTQTTPQPVTARMLLQVPAGGRQIAIRFKRTPDRTAGAAISGLSAIVLLGGTLAARRRRSLASSA